MFSVHKCTNKEFCCPFTASLSDSVENDQKMLRFEVLSPDICYPEAEVKLEN